MQFTVLLASLVSVTAFAPSKVASKASALKMSFDSEIGVINPTGFWDPLNLTKDMDSKTFELRRTAELKHGRVAMLAVAGLIAADVARFPGSIDLDGTTFNSIPNGVGALTAINPFGWFQIAASVGFWEIFGWKQSEGEPVGDFGFPGADWKGYDDAKKNELRLKELQNGRLAMIGAIELIAHDFSKPIGSGLFDLNWY